MKNQKTAHWEDCSNGWLCSCCGYSYINDYKVCPNCKYKMRNASKSDIVEGGE